MKTWFVSLVMMIVPFLCGAENVYTLNEQWIDCGNGVQLLDPYYSTGITFTWDGSSKNGKADGKGTAVRYKNGEVVDTYVGEYKNGVREGKGTVTYPNGTVKTGIFTGGQLTGKGSMEADNGNVYEGEFVNYTIHGNGKLKFGNGSTFEGFFKAGIPLTGKYTRYDGTVMYIQDTEPVEKINEKPSNYKPKIGKKLTLYYDSDWHRTDDAKKATYYRVVTFEAPHRPQGTVKDFYMNGALQGEAECAYLDYDHDLKNFLEGKFTMYYPNGQLKTEAYYFNGHPNGTHTSYYENGNRESVENYENGVPEGIWAEFYENGKIKSYSKKKEGNLVNNEYFRFSEDGDVCFKVYNENFEQNRKQWEEKSVNGELRVNDNNTITFEVTPGRQLSGGIYTGFSPTEDNGLNVWTRREDSSDDLAIGLLFGFKDWDNYCGFFICGNDYYYQQKKFGKVITHYDWEYSDLIEPDLNMLGVLNVDNDLLFKINGETLGSVKKPRYSGDMCVLTVMNNGKKEAVVDAGRFEIYEWLALDEDPSSRLPGLDGGTASGGWKASGSGFFLTENGLLATNYHVVEGMGDIEVTFDRNGEKESYPAAVVLSDKKNDISILRIESKDFVSMPEIPYNFTTQIKDTGSEVFTLGFPISDVLSQEVKYTDGKISAKSGIQNDPTVYQISVPIQHGNSGGPLFDSDGNLVGITSSGLNREYFQSENVNFAIKTSYLKDLVDMLPQHVDLQTKADIKTLPLTEKIKMLEPYMIYIKVK